MNEVQTAEETSATCPGLPCAPDIILLRALVVGVGPCWSVAFIAIALGYQLQLYADGAMFSYAVAVEDVWAFHWHNISGRLSVSSSACCRPKPMSG